MCTLLMVLKELFYPWRSLTRCTLSSFGSNPCSQAVCVLGDCGSLCTSQANIHRCCSWPKRPRAGTLLRRRQILIRSRGDFGQLFWCRVIDQNSFLSSSSTVHFMHSVDGRLLCLCGQDQRFSRQRSTKAWLSYSTPLLLSIVHTT